MTAVASQQQLPKLINEMPPGHAKEIVMRLQGQQNRYNKTVTTTLPFVTRATTSIIRRLELVKT